MSGVSSGIEFDTQIRLDLAEVVGRLAEMIKGINAGRLESDNGRT
jgi:hypothetical protein